MRKAKRLSRGAVVAFVAVFAALIHTTPAQAQLPPIPQLPRVELPEPVAGAAITAIDTVVPVVGNTAIQARPVATAVGFGLRAPCAAVGGATFVLALGSSIVVLPVPTGVFLGPAVISCSGAFEEGPADPVLEQLDDAVGAAFEEQAGAVLDQVSSGLDPAKPTLDDGCGVVRIFGCGPAAATAALASTRLHRDRLRLDFVAQRPTGELEDAVDRHRLSRVDGRLEGGVAQPIA